MSDSPPAVSTATKSSGSRWEPVISFIFHILINGLAVTFALWFLPGIQASPSFVTLQFLAAGFLFGVLNAFLRPFIVLFTGKLIIRSFGLFIVVINAILLAVLAWILDWQIDNVISILFAGFVIGVVLAVLDAIFGVNRPLIKDADEYSGIWNLLIKYSGNRSNQLITNLRFQQVYDLIYQYAMEIALDRVPFVGTIREKVGQYVYGGAQTTISGLNTPAQVRVMLQELGPTFVKFGQMISSRAEALPPEWQEEFNKLQSNVPPFPGAEAIQIVEKQLGKPITELFAQFSPEPFAAASTAQVHRAQLFDGTDVVVKVQRPNIVPKIKADLQILGEVLQTLSARIEWMRENDVLGIFGEFASNLLKELDYRNEAFNARQLADTMSAFPEVTVPRMFRELTTAKVLTMSFESGVKITNVAKIEAAGIDPEALARTFLRVMIKQIVFDGYFHGDAHPGNILVNLQNGNIIFLDLGMMGMLNQEQRVNLADLIWVLNSLDAYEISETLLRLCTPFKDVHVEKFREDIDRTVVRYMRYPDEAESLSAVLNSVFTVLADNGLRLGSELTMALKTLIQAEAIVHTLDTWLDITREAFGFIQAFMVEQFTVEKVKANVQTQVTRTLKDVVRRIPDLQQATMKWLNQYEKGKFEVEVNTDELNSRLDIFNVAAQRLAIGIVLLGMIIGSAFATSIEGSFLGIEFSSLAFLIFIFAIITGTIMAIRMMRSINVRPHAKPRIYYDK